MTLLKIKKKKTKFSSMALDYERDRFASSDLRFTLK